MTNLPKSWLALKLGDVVEYGATEKVEPDQIGVHTWVLELEDIERDTSRIIDRRSYLQRLPKSAKNRFHSGDVLYGKLRPYLNKVIRAPGCGVCTTEIVPLRGNLAVDTNFLFYWLRHPLFLRYVSDASHGVNMPRLGTEAGRNAPFVLAPRAEQERIAEKLDISLARVTACKERLDRASSILQRFRQAVLSAAVSGRLTADWRKEHSCDKEHPTGGDVTTGTGCATSLTTNQADLDSKHATEAPWRISSKWRWASAADVCEFITKGTTPAKEKMKGAGEVPFIKVYNLTFNGKLDFSVDPTFVSRDVHIGELKRSIVRPGDVLMNIVGPPLGKVSVVPPTYAEWNINQAIARFRPSEAIVSSFLTICLMSPELTAYAARRAKATAGQFNLTLEVCRGLPIPLPCKGEQREIVDAVQRLFALADRLESRLTVMSGIATKLTPGLIGKAFRGELVPQDPNDEPAVELLERLRSSLSATTNAPRHGQRSQKMGQNV